MAFTFEVNPDFESVVDVEYHVGFGNGAEGVDYESLGIDPNGCTEAKPGSEHKVLMLAARYASGLPLWHDEDRYDHGPGGVIDPEDELEGH